MPAVLWSKCCNRGRIGLWQPTVGISAFCLHGTGVNPSKIQCDWQRASGAGKPTNGAAYIEEAVDGGIGEGVGTGRLAAQVCPPHKRHRQPAQGASPAAAP